MFEAQSLYSCEVSRLQPARDGSSEVPTHKCGLLTIARRKKIHETYAIRLLLALWKSVNGRDIA
jgi:hypothetical protein